MGGVGPFKAGEMPGSLTWLGGWCMIKGGEFMELGSDIAGASLWSTLLAFCMC